ncbi:NAD(P)/FAD-dependent oxidoreductase [Cumulibacter manganitolerans]|uniref:NAD(P)/FAD-dependent oxidoreductase n=1 Tax=Cumulibacter manganitolerans TaxID=1884992 RepID=UPI0012973530|nr:NAD(P)/FAD-dependent oxidoreductase [Cumulibacter manganitolerans]
MDHDVTIVGAGLAGLSAAVALTRRGYDVVVLEQEPVVGGRVRTDDVDGYQLDRGFQILNSAYPAVRRMVDLPALRCHRFDSGMLVRRDGRLVTLAHPVRHPALLPPTLRSGLLQPRDVIAAVRWLAPVLAAPRRVVAGPDRTLRAAWDRAGLRGRLRSQALEPFLAGVLAEDDLATSDAFVRLLMRMFVLGRPLLPERGMRALPQQLAERLGDARVHLDCQVTGIDDTASGDGVVLRCADRAPVRSRAVLVATGPRAAARLTGAPSVPTKGLTTWWFGAAVAPSSSRLIAVDGTRSGPLVNTAVVSNVAPGYAPRGRHLVQASALLRPRTEVSEAQARAHAARIWGTATDDWELITRHDIPDALPEQPAPLRVTSATRWGPRRYVAGDHRDTASIQGALVSGQRAAASIVEDLRSS